MDSAIILNCPVDIGRANVAQLAEQPIRNQQVGGSSPFIGSIEV